MKTKWFFQFLVIVTLVLMTLSPNSASAQSSQVLYAVQGGQTSGACDSWENACELQYALTSAVSGQEIWVAAGVYKPTTDPSDRTATFQLKSGVGLYGGFAGAETARDERNWETNKTVLSGDIDNNDINTDGNFIAENTADIQGANTYHVVTGSGANDTAMLDGFIVNAGQADSGNNYGGGIYIYQGSPTLTNTIFTANSANWGGGGMFNDGNSSPTLMNITFSDNYGSYGGGVFNASGNPILMNVNFNNNMANYAGGMFNSYGSNPMLTN